VKHDWETLIPLLVHIQANLEGDLSLTALSRRAGLSPFHFQRGFKAAIGKTPKAYVWRLRLERGAFRLLSHESNLLDIALECGFQNHETFSRAFRRRFGKSPGNYREWVRGQAPSWAEQGDEELVDPSLRFEISETKVVRLRPLHVAFVRHVGALRIGTREYLQRIGIVGGASPVNWSSGLDGDRSRRPRYHAA
jgi:AraC family transcriptional regulator